MSEQDDERKALHRVTDAVLHISHGLSQLTEAVRDLDTDISAQDERRAREYEFVRGEISKLDKGLALLHAKLDEARGDIGEVKTVAEETRERTDPRIMLPDRRHEEKARGLDSITVSEAARFIWPILRRLLPLLALGGGGVGIWRIVELLKGTTP